MAGTILVCPHCQNPYGGRIFGVCSGLGPSVYVCGKCGERFGSGRREWAEMGSVRRMWYWVMSGVYTALLGTIWGFATLCAVQLVVSGRKVMTSKSMAPEGPVFWTGVAVVAVAVVVVQAVRVRWSTRRSQGLDPPYLVTRFWSLQVDLQGLSTALPMLAILGALAVDIVLRPRI